MERMRGLMFVMCGCAIAACGGSGTGGNGGGGGGGGGSSSTAQAFVFVPETCTDSAGSFTTNVIYLPETTNYCSYVESHPNDSSCPPNGEKVLQIVVGASNNTGPVAPIGPGSYVFPYASATRYTGNGTSTCPTVFATTGSVTLTSVDGGIKGTYTFTMDGKEVTGSIDAEICYKGLDTNPIRTCTAN